MTAARELRLAQRALRTTATHFANVHLGSGPAPDDVRSEAYALCQDCHRLALRLNKLVQAVQAADSARRRARRDVARRAA